MATINIAKHFRLDHLIGALTPGRCADFVLLDSLHHIKPVYVFKDGKIVAKDGKLSQEMPSGVFPEFLNNTIKLSSEFKPSDFAVLAEGSSAKLQVINLYPDQIINFATQEWLEISAGEVKPLLEEDILKLAVVKRYGKNGRVALSKLRSRV